LATNQTWQSALADLKKGIQQLIEILKNSFPGLLKQIATWKYYAKI